MTRPYERRPSSAIHSMFSGASEVSPLASTNGLPCSITIMVAIWSMRSRSRSAALRMIFERSSEDILRQTSKPLAAAASARSRSAISACATVPIGSPVAGFSTGSVLPACAGPQTPSISS